MIFPELESWLLSFGFIVRDPGPDSSPSGTTYAADTVLVRIGDSTGAPIRILREVPAEQLDGPEILHEDEDPAAALATLRDLIYGKRILTKRISVMDERRPDAPNELQITVADASEVRTQLGKIGASELRIDTAFQVWHGHSGESGVRKGEETFPLDEFDQKRFLEITPWRDRGGREIWERPMIAIVD